MTGGRLDLTELFFASTGRLARGPFLLASAALLILAMLYDAVLAPPYDWLIGIFFYPMVVFCGMCLLSKRLHDRGRSGWWAGVVVAALVANWPREHGIFQQPFIIQMLGFVFVIVIIWSFVELCLLPGEQGSNRHGVSPLRTAGA